MDDEQEVRARTSSSTSDGVNGDPGEAGDATADDRLGENSTAPRRLEPPRPWLKQPANGTPPQPPIEPLPAEAEAGSQRLQPIRPWLKQNRPAVPVPVPVPVPGARSKPPTADHSRVLDPTRPWLDQPQPATPRSTTSPTPSNAAAVLEPLATGIDASASPDPEPKRSRVFGRRSSPSVDAPVAVDEPVVAPEVPTPLVVDEAEADVAVADPPAAEAVQEVPAEAEAVTESVPHRRRERRQPKLEKEPPRHAALPGNPSWPIAFESPELAEAANSLLKAELGPAPATIAGSEEVAAAPRPGRLSKARRWLFEQAPARDEEPAVPPERVAGVAQAAAEPDGEGWSTEELSTLAADPPAPSVDVATAVEPTVATAVEPTVDPTAEPTVDPTAEPTAEPVSLSRRPSPRGDLARRLSAPLPGSAGEPTTVPTPTSLPLRPTIDWAEIEPAAPPEEPSPEEPSREEPSREEPSREEPSSETPDPGAAADDVTPLVPQPEAEPSEPEGEPSSTSELSAEAAPAAAAPTARPRPRPRPFATAQDLSDESSPASVPHRVTPSIAAAAAPASLTRAHAPAKDDFFTRSDDDDDEPPTGSKGKSSGDGGSAGHRSRRWLIRTGVILAIAVLAATLLRVYVVAPYYIPSGSMEPTLHGCTGCNNDHVLVDKLSYRMHDIHRGDVIVFHRPSTWQVPETTLIKRVVGLPGDKIKVVGGKLFINGLLLEESYTNSKCPAGSSGTGNLADTKTYGPIPLNEVYVMGDNRCDSSDSRMFGPVPDSKVVGRAFVIIWPLGRIRYL